MDWPVFILEMMFMFSGDDSGSEKPFMGGEVSLLPPDCDPTAEKKIEISNRSKQEECLRKGNAFPHVPKMTKILP